MSFADKINQYVEHAPVSGFTPVNYGSLLTEIMVVTWEGEKGARSKKTTTYTDEYELKKGESLEAVFTVKISELNPAINFDYVRTVPIMNSGTQKADWDIIVLPSLVAVFGDKWADTILGKKAVFVAVEDVANAQGKTPKPTTDNPNPRPWGCPKFQEKFKNLEACKAARDERFGAVTAEAMPSDDDGEDGEIPEAIAKQVKALYESLGKNDKTLKTMLATKPFGDFSVDALMATLK